MKYTFDHDIHIHSQLSLCSDDPNQAPTDILNYARQKSLSTVCITDHFWDSSVPGASEWYKPQDFEHIKKAFPLPSDGKIRFLFGCETEMDLHGTVGISKELYDAFDFIIIPTTHFHMKGFTLSEDDLASPETRANAWIRRFDAVLSLDAPFHKIGLAHPICAFIGMTKETTYQTVEKIPEAEMIRLFKEAARLGIGIEINASDMKWAQKKPEILMKPFTAAKECGCKFYLGSDAHHPRDFEIVAPAFEWAINYLKLDESDKFKI